MLCSQVSRWHSFGNIKFQTFGNPYTEIKVGGSTEVASSLKLIDDHPHHDGENFQLFVLQGSGGVVPGQQDYQENRRSDGFKLLEEASFKTWGCLKICRCYSYYRPKDPKTIYTFLVQTQLHTKRCFWLREELKKCLCSLVRSSVRSVQTCLEQSILIILAQIFKQSVRNKSAVSEHSENTQRALRERSESYQRAIREQSESNQRAIRGHSERNESIKIRVIQSEPINTASC